MARRARKRIQKEARRNLRLWAEGLRETILTPHIENYTDALDRSWREEREYVQKVCNEFHSRISWRLEDHEEPEAPLTEYDPNAVVVPEVLDDDETQQKRNRVSLLNAVRSYAALSTVNSM